ncbi:DUF4192 family protein [Streptomyces sp. Amel2xB2]|uniref:DUF4192 family protein n=1 Tax=Streptomyces sp. Amel2xB2 TaxID=1305829 RepID=UPI0035CD238D
MTQRDSGHGPDHTHRHVHGHGEARDRSGDGGQDPGITGGQETGAEQQDAAGEVPPPRCDSAPPDTGYEGTGRSDIALRGPAELADALPYLLGFYPDDSIVVVALHGPRGRFGGRIRLGIPADRDLSGLPSRSRSPPASKARSDPVSGDPTGPSSSSARTRAPRSGGKR